MSVLEKLLEEGRKVLLAKDEAAEQAAEARYEKLDAIFQEARKAALKLFAPLGAKLLVQSCCHRRSHNDYRDPTELTFTIHPFEGVPVQVHLRRWNKDWEAKDGPGYDLAPDGTVAGKHLYYVGWEWTWRECGEGIWVSEYKGTCALAEAVALAEQAVARRKDILEKYDAACDARQQRKDEEKYAPKQRDLACRLLDLLDEVISRHAPGE